MPMVDALAVWTEEGRVLERDIDDESLSRHYESSVSEWGNPLSSNTEESRLWRDGELGELKHLSTRRKRNHMRFR